MIDQIKDVYKSHKNKNVLIKKVAIHFDRSEHTVRDRWFKLWLIPIDKQEAILNFLKQLS